MKTRTQATILAMLIALFSLTLTNTFAQLRTPSSIGEHLKGIVTLESGEEIEGFIYFDMINPQLFQKRVLLVTDEANATFSEWEEAKKNQVKYDANDVKSFTLENGKKFIRAKYSNLFAKKKRDKIPQNLLLEAVTEGKITVFKKYHHTQGIVSSNLPNRSKVTDAEYAEWQENNFEILVQKEGEEPVNLSTINIKKLVGDKRAVLMNYAKDVYGFRTQFTKGPVFESSFQTDALEALVRMVEDYNNEETSAP